MHDPNQEAQEARVKSEWCLTLQSLAQNSNDLQESSRSKDRLVNRWVWCAVSFDNYCPGLSWLLLSPSYISFPKNQETKSLVRALLQGSFPRRRKSFLEEA